MSFRRFSLLAGVVVPVPVPPEVMDALEKVEIVAAIGERGAFRLRFRLDRGSTLPARFLLDSGDLVRVVLTMEHGGDQEVAMDGVTVTHSVSTGGSTGSKGTGLVVGGEDVTLLMDLIDNSGRPFPGMAVADRVRVILAGYSVHGMTAVVLPPPVTDVPSPSERIFHQHGTDYSYVQSLARRVGYRFTLDPGPVPGASVAYWGPEPRGDRSHPSRVIRFRRPGNVEKLQLRYDAIGAVAPQATILEPVSKAMIPIPLPSIASLAPPLGAVVPPPHRHRRLRGAAKLTAMQAAGAVLAEAARSAAAMSGQGTLKIVRGERRLRPGDIVDIRGAADPFDGLFTVSRVHDTVTARHHRQELELLRVGLGRS